jgi:WD40 repeat protein/class 3 adenylate cyclase/energy-coupling factor transporter ATP-binding protein EcfA2
MTGHTTRGPGAPSGRAAGTEILTFLIADVRGYTHFTQTRGDEAAARLASTFAEIAREGVEAFGGEVIELRGDEALAVFSSTRQALRSATELQLAFVDETERRPSLPFRVGIGLDAGEAVPVEGGYRGGALNLAARLCSNAGPGEVLASQGVLHLARAVDGLTFVDGGALELKGIAEPVPVAHVVREGWDPGTALERLDRVAGSADAAPARPEVPIELDRRTPIEGADRTRNARHLRWAWRVARRGSGSFVLVTGPRGGGKTRMAAEVAALAADDGASVLYASGRDVTPVVRAASETRSEPLLLVVDDLDLAAPGELAPLDDVVRSLGGRPILVVGTARTDGPDPGASALPVTPDETIALEPLDVEAVEAISRSYATDGNRPPVTAIHEASGGRPLDVHRLASEWARGEAARRLGEAATRAVASRSNLRAMEAEVADTVIDLQFARERAELLGDAAVFDGTRVSPYKGLASFEVDDAAVFFGRERLVAEMIGRLAGAKLLGVVGPSGSGKSSAVRAGLLPALETGVMPEAGTWLRAVVRPGAYPLRALDRAVWASLSEQLRERLEGAELPLRAVRDALGPDERVIVAVDQFEELFTHCADEDERTAFVRALVEAATDPRGAVLVVIAIRADHYGRCAAYPELADLLASSHVLVGPMTADGYARAITGPAARAGLHVEPALVDALVAEVVDEPGGLPLLSSALLELWQRRHGRTIPLEAHRMTGGVRGAVGRLAEEAYGGLEPEEQDVAKAVMLRLAGSGEGDAVVRRRVPLEELDVGRNDRVTKVVEVLTTARLLTVSDGALEVAHEALLREWPRLRSWLEDDRAGQQLHGHMITAAKTWEAGGRDPGELYRGARLATALDWTVEHPLELNELERDFINESRTAAEAEAARQRRANRRLRVLLVGTALFLLVAVIAGSLALVQRGKAERAAEVALAKGLGAQAVVEDELDTSLLLAREAIAIDDSVDTRSTLLASLLKAPGAISVLPGTGDRVLEIHASADHSTLVTADNIGGVAVYDTEALELRGIVRMAEGSPIALSPDGGTFATPRFTDDGPAIVLVATGDGSERTIPLDGGDVVGERPLAYAPDGSELASLEIRPGVEGVLLVRRDPATGAELRSDPLPMTEPTEVRFSPDGEQILVAAFEPNEIVLIDANTMQELGRFERIGFAFDLTSDGQTLAMGGDEGTVLLVDVASGDRTTLEGRHNASVTGAGFSPDASTLVTTGDDRSVIVWDVTSGGIREILSGHAGRVFGPAFDASGSTAFTVGLDSKVIAWDLSSERRIGRRFDYADPATVNQNFDLVSTTSPDGSMFAVSPGNGRVAVHAPGSTDPMWEVDAWTEDEFARILAEDEGFADFDADAVTSLAFDRKGAILAVSGQHSQVVTYDAATGSELARWWASEIAWVNSLVFDGDGALITANDDGRVAWWDPRTGELRRELQIVPFEPDPEAFVGGVARAVPSPDGSTLAVVTYSLGGPQFLQLLDADSGDVRWDGAETDLFNTVLAWSPDSRRIATGGWQSGELTLWDAATGEPVGSPAKASAGFVLSVEFAWDGSLIVTGATDGTVRLFDATTLTQVGSNIAADDNIWALAHVLPGDEMLVLSFIGHAWHWDLDPARWADQACDVANRNLTESEWNLFLPERDYAPSCPS